MSNRDELIEEAKAFCYRYPNPPENWDIRGISATMVDFALDHANRENTRLCLLLADIRTALGDPEGKLMQKDFVEYCKEVVGERDRLRELEKVARKIYPKRMQCFGLDGADEANDLHRTIMRLSPYLSEQSYQDYLKREAALAGKE